MPKQPRLEFSWPLRTRTARDSKNIPPPFPFFPQAQDRKPWDIMFPNFQYLESPRKHLPSPQCHPKKAFEIKQEKWIKVRPSTDSNPQESRFLTKRKGKIRPPQGTPTLPVATSLSPKLMPSGHEDIYEQMRRTASAPCESDIARASDELVVKKHVTSHKVSYTPPLAVNLHFY